MAFGVVLLVWASIRVVLLRKSIQNARVKDIKGLMMCECQLYAFSKAYVLTLSR
jgi:sodium/potassium-transporting ATPase subunit alpha